MDRLDDRSQDLFAQYRTIAAKLRRRFMKKPNAREANEDYGKLANALKNEDNPQYAALCFTAMAKCDQLTGDTAGEAEAWASAGRQFLQAEEILYSARHASYEESLEAGVQCFLLAIDVHERQKNDVLAAMFCLEIAHRLKHFKKLHESLRFLERAADLQSKTPECQLQTLEEVAVCKIKLRERNTDGGGQAHRNAAYSLLLPGKVLHLNALNCSSMRKFRDRGNKAGAKEAWLILQKDGLGELCEVKARRGSPTVLQFRKRSVPDDPEEKAEFTQKLQAYCVSLQQYQSSLEQCDITLDTIATQARQPTTAAGEYDSALSVLTRITNDTLGKEGCYALLRRDCEVTQLLLLLMLQIPNGFMRAEHVQLLAKYSEDMTGDQIMATEVNMDLYLLLHSLVIAVQRKKEFGIIQQNLWKLLKPEQQNLLSIIIEVHSPHLHTVM